MYLIVTRAFPPELGGMQSLMWGLTKEMSKNFMIKVFADYQENHKEFDKNENFSIERVGGIKFLRKIRKAQLVNEFLKDNKVQGVIADHWKSLELINTNKNRVTSYVGYTNNLVKRLALHNKSKGAKFTKGRKWTLIYKKCYKTKSLAMKNEYILKKNQKKRNLIKKKFIENN